MKRIFKVLLTAIPIILLTVISQWGGMILLISLLIVRRFWRSERRGMNFLRHGLAFVILYTLFNLIIIPFFAGLSGRIPLPGSAEKGPVLLRNYTAILNRSYVSSTLFNVLSDVSTELEANFPGSRIACLDACFPNIDGFPLLPHLSHNDGDKVDLAFLYKDARSKEELNLVSPSAIGYGVHIAPKNENEFSCTDEKYWQYDLLRKAVPQYRADDFILDEDRTAYLVMALCNHPEVGKVFLEPHLKDRLGLEHPKLRFQGCHSVRHDDHIHVQLK